ncbi:MAG: SpoIIE family protein phosphatase, partial [Bacteroidales bacterium]
KEIHANDILNELRAHVIKSLRQTGKEGESKDGMDIALCIIDTENMELEFSGANNPLLLVRNEELQVFKGDKMPIGIHHRAKEPFNLHTINLQEGDILYTHSDGYVDQFGGPEGKKFMSKKFKELLVEIHKKDMQEQKSILENTLMDWMKNTEQVDDVLVMGVRI